MSFLANLKLKIKKDPFKYIILLLVILIFCCLLFIKDNFKRKDNLNNITTNELLVFVQDNCLHCINAEQFLADNTNKYKDIDIIFYNLKDRESQVLLFKNIAKLNIPQESLGTPIFIMRDDYIIGFSEEQKSKLNQLLKEKKIRKTTN